MPCFFPLSGWVARRSNPSGKRSVVFDKSKGFADKGVQVPCGQCVGCRLERSRQWAIRCVHESSLHERNCFLTLTYSNENFPVNGSLVLEDFQKFMKRLRKRFGAGIRFFHCGEYGEKYGRPHYHVCLFGFDFPDKKVWKSGEVPLFTSAICERLWTKGYCVIGDVTFDSAAYVARYIMKKITGDKSAEHYKGRKPEYVTMSRRPGIGRGWYEKWKGDVFPHDFVVMRGRKMRPPKFYTGILEQEAQDLFARVKAKRAVAGQKNIFENDSFRLPPRELVTKAKLGLLKREVE